MKRWAYSMHTCSRIVQDIANMLDHTGDREEMSHKAEKPSRITLDQKDGDKIGIQIVVPLISSMLLLVRLHMKR